MTNQGIQKQLLRTTGSILSAQFAPTKQTIYCVLTQLLQGKTYQEQPYLAAIDMNSGKQKPLVVLPDQMDVQMSLSPDGLALLFDQVVTATNSSATSQANAPLTAQGETITTGRLWLLPLLPTISVQGKPTQLQPEQLPLPGFHPQWLP